ncbi:hypothetical protein SAMN04488243_13410 [Thermus arciformis]|uniref:Uncharacterized protein n=1 Tax=Thermus arciformis TaxID=482827 RepID=A0A1G7JFU8_9DEIN|nr:hypothetical protein [Thermus arciformis]SDF23763.1 hypothetical protein SAMN04488243_13410 [Thermus arciformis]
MVPVRLPLYGPARAEGPMGPLPLRRKALGVLYYLALEGPTRREKLADLLWGHGAALQNLRAELTHLRTFFGKEAFRGPVLALPPGVELDRTPVGGEALEGLEDLSPLFADWVQGLRARLSPDVEAVSFPERLKGVRPPALVVLIGPPGSGREALAQALAARLGLPFRRGMGQGSGVFYFGEPLPPKEAAFSLSPAPGQVVVVARSSFGEDPAFLLVLRARFPAALTVVERVPRLPWEEARKGLLARLPFAEAARFYLRSGGRVEVLQELLALANPEALPQRIRAMVALEARYLPQEVRRTLEVLALHPGPWPEKLAQAMGCAEALDELEHRGWFLLREGRYHLSEPQFRPYLAAGLAEGERFRIHGRLAEVFRDLGDPVAEAYHRLQQGEGVDYARLERELKGWRRAVVLGLKPSTPPPAVRVGWRRALGGPREVQLVSLDGERAEEVLELEAPSVVHLAGLVYQELPFGLGASLEAFPLRLRSGEREVCFLPGQAWGHFFWGTVLPQEPLDYRFLLPSGRYFLELGTPGIASLRLAVAEVTPGAQEALVPLGVPVEFP